MTPKPQAKDENEGAPALPGLLVEPAWLRGQLAHTRLRIVDLREPGSWAEAHVPGAVNLQLAQLGTGGDGLDNVLLDPERFARLMSELGISNGDAVVAYDDQWGLAASRLVWALHRYGHSAVSLLNGGWDKWQDESGPTTVDAGPTVRGRFRVTPRSDVYADLALVRDLAENRTAVLVDTRTRAEYDRGHLPDALCWDWFTAVPPGSWDASRPPEELLAEWAGLGLNPSADVVVYCRSGMRAAHTYVMLRHAGFPSVKLYDGSWQEWSANMETTHGD
jgi:thiosulfate/3-mercaptopyruvate sulfurtransferase